MSYTSDNADIAFGDPLAVLQKKYDKKAKDKVKNDRNNAKRRKNGDIDARRNMHAKFG